MSDLGERILAGARRPREEVDVPEWRQFIGDAKLYVASMSVEDYGSYEAQMFARREAGADAVIKSWTELLVARCIVDENWERVFSEEQMRQLKSMDHVPFRRLLDVAVRINKLRTEDVEALEKNSSGVPASDSATA